MLQYWRFFIWLTKTYISLFLKKQVLIMITTIMNGNGWSQCIIWLILNCDVFHRLNATETSSRFIHCTNENIAFSSVNAIMRGFSFRFTDAGQLGGPQQNISLETKTSKAIQFCLLNDNFKCFMCWADLQTFWQYSKFVVKIFQRSIEGPLMCELEA